MRQSYAPAGSPVPSSFHFLPRDPNYRHPHPSTLPRLSTSAACLLLLRRSSLPLPARWVIKRSVTKERFLFACFSLTSAPAKITATLPYDVRHSTIQTQPQDSNPSQLFQLFLSLATDFVTPSRRTLPWCATAWRQESQPRSAVEAALWRVTKATRTAVSGGVGRGGRS